MHTGRTMMSWILLVAMLLSLPGRVTGHFVCMRGMAEAGATCPRCHTHAAAGQTAADVGNSCCKFVAGQPAANAGLAPARVQGPEPTRASLPRTEAGLGVAGQPDRDPSACAVAQTTPRSHSSNYLSSFLRL